jgi:hypothetical protein
MFSALTITSTKQGFTFDAAASARAFAIIEGLIGFAAELVRAVPASKVSLSRPVRLADA